MAQDVLDLLDHLDWTQPRSVHVVGISMGGMISLELAKAAPERIASLSLISTTSGRGNGEKPFSVSLPPVS
jgi:pimeloyl-ACP methyl ester carboxylesterase